MPLPEQTTTPDHEDPIYLPYATQFESAVLKPVRRFAVMFSRLRAEWLDGK